jgi:hypothetical protein
VLVGSPAKTTTLHKDDYTVELTKTQNIYSVKMIIVPLLMCYALCFTSHKNVMDTQQSGFENMIQNLCIIEGKIWVMQSHASSNLDYQSGSTLQ